MDSHGGNFLSNDYQSSKDSVSIVEADERKKSLEKQKSFHRSSSAVVMQRNKGAAYEKVGEEGVNKMHRWTVLRN